MLIGLVVSLKASHKRNCDRLTNRQTPS